MVLQGHYLVFFGLFFFSTVAFAEYKGEVVEYGYYVKISEPTRYQNLSSTSGFVKEGGEVRLSEQVDKIPMQLNRLFGFKFKLTGFEGKDTVQVKLSVQHPEMTRPNGSKATEYSYPVVLDVKDGVVVNQTGYSMDHEYELVEGEWIFEIWYYRQKLISQTFTTYVEQEEQ